MQPYNPLIVHDAYTNCSFMSFSGGWTPGMAPHIVDLPVWALESGYPTVIYCSGGRYTIKDAGDAPDTQEVTWQYPGFTMTWTMSLTNSFAFDFGRGSPARRLGVYFHGVNGTLFCDYRTYQIVPEGSMLEDIHPPKPSIPPSPGHGRMARLHQEPQAAKLQSTVPRQAGRGPRAGEPLDEAWPVDSIRCGQREDRER